MLTIERAVIGTSLPLLTGMMLAIGLCGPTSAAVRHKSKPRPVAARAAPASVAKAAAPAVAQTPPQAPPEPKPIGKPSDWFPADSYPEAAKVAAQEGRTDFALEIDAKGHIMTCNIVKSSGSELLDTTTCSQIILNGRFEPARDAQGRAVPGRWESAMRWRLLENDTPEE